MNGNTVLFFTYWYPNKNNKSFGIFVKRHAQAVKVKNDVVVLSLNIIKGSKIYGKEISVSVDEMNIETHHVYLESRFNKLLYVLLPLHYFILEKYIRQQLLPKHTFNILHSNILFPCAAVGHRLAQTFGWRHFITEHWSKVDKFFRVSLYRSAGKKAYDRAAAITAVSGHLADMVRKHTSNTVYTVPNVVDSKDFFYDPGIAKNEVFTFIAAAQWGRIKNPFYFLDALKQLVEEKKIRPFQVVLAGTGHLLDLVKQNNYPFPILYKGALNPKELNLEMNKSHVFLHGSESETFSVVIAEALICGLPSVVSPVGIAPEVINASNGFVTNNTTEDWKEKILKCSETTYNNQQIAGQLKNKYDLKTVGGIFDQLYNA